MNDLDLNGMQAAHAFESHGARSLAPTLQAVAVGNVAVNRIDGLYMRGMRSIDHPLTCVERLAPAGRLHHAEIGGVVLQPNRDARNALRGRRDSERILDAEGRFQDRHQPDRTRDPRPLRNRVDSSHNVRYLSWGLDLRDKNEIGRLRNRSEERR